MADEPRGPGWWKASDGRYYPPESHPRYRPPAPPPLPPEPRSIPPRRQGEGSVKRAWRKFRALPTGAQVACWAVVAVIVLAAAVSGGSDDEKVTSGPSATPSTTEAAAERVTSPPTTKVEDRSYEAFEICKKFVKDRLKAPTTATFRNYFEKDGEVLVTAAPDGSYVVASSVDSENSFGAKIRSRFVCQVTPDGSTWHLDDISIV